MYVLISKGTVKEQYRLARQRATRKYREMHSDIIKKTKREYYLRNIEEIKFKNAVRRIVGKAIISGEIIKPTVCSNSGDWCSGNIEAHHKDYSKPLEVIWLCKHCHNKIHYR